MTRKLRIQYAGAIYHVMDRDDHQENIFGDDDDRRLFLGTLEEPCSHAKVALTSRLRKETTVTVDWLAQRLNVGSRGYLAHLLKHPPQPESSNQPRLPI